MPDGRETTTKTPRLEGLTDGRVRALFDALDHDRKELGEAVGLVTGRAQDRLHRLREALASIAWPETDPADLVAWMQKVAADAVHADLAEEAR
jgi:hypothetical protein